MCGFASASISGSFNFWRDIPPGALSIKLPGGDGAWVSEQFPAGELVQPSSARNIHFSDRWFPTREIELWTELHPFEHMGLVLEYFRQAGNFTAVHSESLRGLPRPQDDKYANQPAHSDPVFAAWGVHLKINIPCQQLPLPITETGAPKVADKECVMSMYPAARKLIAQPTQQSADKATGDSLFGKRLTQPK
jgi:hypothetical protein